MTMQHTPDKEFDQLFKDKFADAEIEPSANLWANIEKQLDPKPKRVIPIYWLATAATITIAFTALLMFQKTDKIFLHGTKSAVQAVTPSVTVNDSEETIIVEQSTGILVAKTEQKMKVVHTLSDSPVNKTEKIAEPLQPNENIARLPIKQADVKPIDVLPKELPLIENVPTVLAQAAPQMALESNVIDEFDNGNERKGIRNVGDLVNFVVDKVDKREKKFLKFNTDDDDNSSLIGINIGFVKLNKKRI
ncbi:hypothetical protein D9M68_436150 [compost metagenome]